MKNTSNPFFRGPPFMQERKNAGGPGHLRSSAFLFWEPLKPGRTYALISNIGKISLFKKSVVRYFHKRNAKTIAFLPQTDFLAQQAVRAGFDEILTNGKISAISTGC